MATVLYDIMAIIFKGNPPPSRLFIPSFIDLPVWYFHFILVTQVVVVSKIFTIGVPNPEKIYVGGLQ